MTVTCSDCRKRYDDAERFTFCPHERFMSEDMLARKVAGLALLGKRVTFNHMPDAEGWRVSSCGWDGSLSLEGLAGEFAPHLFLVKA